MRFKEKGTAVFMTAAMTMSGAACAGSNNSAEKAPTTQMPAPKVFEGPTTTVNGDHQSDTELIQHLAEVKSSYERQIAHGQYVGKLFVNGCVIIGPANGEGMAYTIPRPAYLTAQANEGSGKEASVFAGVTDEGKAVYGKTYIGQSSGEGEPDFVSDDVQEQDVWKCVAVDSPPIFGESTLVADPNTSIFLDASSLLRVMQATKPKLIDASEFGQYLDQSTLDHCGLDASSVYAGQTQVS